MDRYPRVHEIPKKLEPVDHDTFIDDLKPCIVETARRLTREQLLNPNTILAIDNPPTFERVPN